MDNETQNIIAEQLKILPKELRDAISAVDYPVKLQEIVRNNKLLLDAAGKLETETTLVLLGLEPLNDYVDNLVKNVGLPKNQALIVAHDVNELIFKNVRESLRKINEEAIAAENKQVAPNEPTKEEILSRIEMPENIKTKEASVSVSSLKSNSGSTMERPADLVSRGVEVRKEMLPEIEPFSVLPKVSSLIITGSPANINSSPVQNIVKSKMEDTVIVPKKIVVMEESTKLPTKIPTDPYREAVN